MTSIAACRNNFHILKKGPQTPCERFGIMVWYGMVWYDMEWYEVSIPWYDGIGMEVIPLLEWGTTKVP